MQLLQHGHIKLQGLLVVLQSLRRLTLRQQAGSLTGSDCAERAFGLSAVAHVFRQCFDILRRSLIGLKCLGVCTQVTYRLRNLQRHTGALLRHLRFILQSSIVILQQLQHILDFCIHLRKRIGRGHPLPQHEDGMVKQSVASLIEGAQLSGSRRSRSRSLRSLFRLGFGSLLLILTGTQPQYRHQAQRHPTHRPIT